LVVCDYPVIVSRIPVLFVLLNRGEHSTDGGAERTDTLTRNYLEDWRGCKCGASGERERERERVTQAERIEDTR